MFLVHSPKRLTRPRKSGWLVYRLPNVRWWQKLFAKLKWYCKNCLLHIPSCIFNVHSRVSLIFWLLALFSHSKFWFVRKDYYACPDDETFRFMAGVYSLSHHNMSFSEEFKGGITNGAAWYGNKYLKKWCSKFTSMYHGSEVNELFSFEVHFRIYTRLLQVPHIWWHARLELYTCWLFRVDFRDYRKQMASC